MSVKPGWFTVNTQGAISLYNFIYDTICPLATIKEGRPYLVRKWVNYDEVKTKLIWGCFVFVVGWGGKVSFVSNHSWGWVGVLAIYWVCVCEWVVMCCLTVVFISEPTFVILGWVGMWFENNINNPFLYSLNILGTKFSFIQYKIWTMILNPFYYKTLLLDIEDQIL